MSLELRWKVASMVVGLVSCLTTAHGQCSGQATGSGGIGPGVDGEVHCMIEWDEDGEGGNEPVIVIGGRFQIAGNAPASNIATWNGSSWSALGTGVGGGGQYGTFVRALTVTADNKLIVAGDLTRAGGLTVANIAIWDPSSRSWSRLGGGLNAPVYTLHTLTDGSIVAGGQFTQAGSVAASRIANWNGSTWSPLGAGVSGSASGSGPMVTAIAQDGDSLLVGGFFSNAGGVSAEGFASWNGSGWSRMDGPRNVLAFHRLPSGDLVAAGANVGIWNGQAWSTLTGLSTALPNSVASLPDGRVAVVSSTSPLDPFGGQVYLWTGSAWQLLGPGPGPNTLPYGHFCVLSAGGSLYLGGYRTLSGSTVVNGVARWSGTAWQPLSAGGLGANQQITALAPLPSGGFLASGAFTAAGTTSLERACGRFVGGVWSHLGTGNLAPFAPSDLFVAPNGTQYAASGSDVLRRSATQWTPIGDANYGYVNSFARLPNGDIVVGGAFTEMNGAAISRVARWNGTAWAGFGSGLDSGPSNGDVEAVLVSPAGDLYAAGDISIPGVSGNRVARWNGTAWEPVGGALTGGVHDLAWPSSGRLVAVGQFLGSGTTGGRHVVEWDGANWRNVGGGANSFVLAAAVDARGDLVIGGQFTQVGTTPAKRIARWSNGAWTEMAGGADDTVWDVATLSDGTIVAAGDFTALGGAPAGHWGVIPDRLRRWVGSAGGSWHDAGNWSPAVVPTSEDEVWFDLAGSYTVTVGQAALAKSIGIKRGRVEISMSLPSELVASCGMEVEAGATLAGTVNLRGSLRNKGTIETSQGAYLTTTPFTEPWSFRIVGGTLTLESTSQVKMGYTSWFIPPRPAGILVLQSEQDPPIRLGGTLRFDRGNNQSTPRHRWEVIKQIMPLSTEAPMTGEFAAFKGLSGGPGVFLAPFDGRGRGNGFWNLSLGLTKSVVEVAVLSLPKFADRTTTIENTSGTRDRLIVSTHGWNGDDSRLWRRTSQMTAFRDFYGLAGRWDIAYLDWRPFCGELADSPNNAAVMATQIGRALGSWIREYARGRYREYHLLGHSAGTWLVDGLADQLVASGEVRREAITGTLFDAFDAPSASSQLLGVRGDTIGRLENYVDRTIGYGYDDLGVRYALGMWPPDTNSYYANAVNVDVTDEPGNPTAEPPAGDPFGTDAHAWPEVWYESTIPNGRPGESCQVLSASGRFSWGFRQSPLFQDARRSGDPCRRSTLSPGSVVVLPQHVTNGTTGNEQSVTLGISNTTFGSTGTGAIGADGFATLTTGSPVEMTTTFASPRGVRWVSFEYEFGQPGRGVLTASVNGVGLFFVFQDDVPAGVRSTGRLYLPPGDVSPSSRLLVRLESGDGNPARVRVGNVRFASGEPACASLLQSPAGGQTERGSTLVLSTRFEGTAARTYSWTRGGVPLANGTSLFGTVSGAGTPTLTIQGITDAATGSYVCRATDSCGFVVSEAAAVEVVAPACTADLDDGSGTGTRDGGVTIEDLIYYLAVFADGATAADVDDGNGQGTRDGGVTIEDLLYYLGRFAVGC